MQQDSLEKETLLKKKPQVIKSNAIQIIDQVWAGITGISVALSYALRQFFFDIFVGGGKCILQPIQALANIIRVPLAWYEAHQNGYKKPGVIRAIVSTVTGIGIAVALLGWLAIGAAFGVVAPILLLVSFGIRSLYLTACAIFHGICFLNTKDPKDKEKSIVNGIYAVAITLNTIAVGVVLIALQASCGIIGIVSGAIAAIFAFYRAFTLNPAVPSPPETKPNLPPRSSDTPKERPMPERNYVYHPVSRCGLFPSLSEIALEQPHRFQNKFRPLRKAF